MVDSVFRRKYLAIFHTATYHTTGLVQRNSKTFDGQSRYYVARQSQQRIKISKAGDLHVRRCSIKFFCMSAPIPCAHPLDHYRAIGINSITRHRRILFAAVLLPHNVVSEFGYESDSV